VLLDPGGGSLLEPPHGGYRSETDVTKNRFGSETVENLEGISARSGVTFYSGSGGGGFNVFSCNGRDRWSKPTVLFLKWVINHK
jgi:hypothetical protein